MAEFKEQDRASGGRRQRGPVFTENHPVLGSELGHSSLEPDGQQLGGRVGTMTCHYAPGISPPPPPQAFPPGDLYLSHLGPLEHRMALHLCFLGMSVRFHMRWSIFT